MVNAAINQEGLTCIPKTAFRKVYCLSVQRREEFWSCERLMPQVSKFLKGSWVDQTDTFVLMYPESLKKKDRADKFKAQSEVLHAKASPSSNGIVMNFLLNSKTILKL
jgi:hypothetical protein